MAVETRNEVKSNGTEQYRAENIQVLKGLEGVRMRPGMYIGSTGPMGLHHILYEIFDNAVDEALAGYCTEIHVTLNKDGSCTVRDNGRGIPPDPHPVEGISTIEVVYTMLHAGGKFERSSYKVSGGLHGVGASVTNALAEWTKVRVFRYGKIFEAEFSRGNTVRSVTEVGAAPEGMTGTEVTFRPDPLIFRETTEFDYETIASRLRQTAYLMAGLKIVLRDERKDPAREEAFHFTNGVVAMVQEMVDRSGDKPVHEGVIHFQGQLPEAEVDVALVFTLGDQERVLSFANNIYTPGGGTHLTGVRSALTRVISEYIQENGNKNERAEEIEGSDVREGLYGVVSVRVHDPQFEGQTKDKFNNSEVRGAIETFLGENLRTYLAENPKVARAIMERVLAAARARKTAKRIRERERKNSALETGVLPGKLADCALRDPSKTELFLVEGDSAGGSAKQGRNREFQAVLPLRGKVLNVEKADLYKALKNEEIDAIVQALGCGVGASYNEERLRYGKVIIMCDADVDGAHIKTLLLTLFYRLFRDLIENGHVYIAMPPLYRVARGTVGSRSYKEIYCQNEEERDEAVRALGGESDKIHVQRFKGLGEMNPEQLWRTTMDPATRVLQRVTITDAVLADQIFSQLMGDDVEPRRRFIEEHARFARNLDI